MGQRRAPLDPAVRPDVVDVRDRWVRPVVSICINNHNYARFLDASIGSALAQQADFAVEVVVVDDGSTDGSREVISAYGDRVRAVYTPNRGQAAAVNCAFEIARGAIVLFLDADDVLRPGVCASIAEAFDVTPRPAKVHYRMAVVDGEGRPTGEILPVGASTFAATDLSAHIRRYRTYSWPPMSANAYDAGALRHLFPIPEDRYRRSADCYLNELVPYLGPVVSLSDIGVDYRRHGSNGYFGKQVDLVWLRSKLERTVHNHDRAVQLARELGVPGPVDDPLRVLDAAFLGFRMASLRLDPEGHMFEGDTAARLACRGIQASVMNRMLRPRDRLIRTGWFALTGFLPAPLARRTVRRFIPDTPQHLRPEWLVRRRRASPPAVGASAPLQ